MANAHWQAITTAITKVVGFTPIPLARGNHDGKHHGSRCNIAHYIGQYNTQYNDDTQYDKDRRLVPSTLSVVSAISWPAPDVSIPLANPCEQAKYYYGVPINAVKCILKPHAARQYHKGCSDHGHHCNVPIPDTNPATTRIHDNCRQPELPFVHRFALPLLLIREFNRAYILKFQRFLFQPVSNCCGNK